MKKCYNILIGCIHREFQYDPITINELGGGGKPSQAVALEAIKGWLEPEGYTVTKEEEIETDLTESHRGYTDFVAPL